MRLGARNKKNRLKWCHLVSVSMACWNDTKAAFDVCNIPQVYDMIWTWFDIWYETTQYGMIRHDTTQCGMIGHDTTQGNTKRYNTIWHDTTRNDPTQYSTIWHDTTRNYMTQYHIRRHNTIRHDMAWYDTTRYDTTRYDTKRYDTIWCEMNIDFSVDTFIQPLFILGLNWLSESLIYALLWIYFTQVVSTTV